MKIGNRRFASMGRAVATILVGVLAAAAPLAAQKNKKKGSEERYRAIAIGTGHVGAAAGHAMFIDFTIERWTTPEETTKILNVIATNDGNKIQRFLEDLPSVGRINLRGQRGEDLRYAFEFEDGGQRILVVASDRPVASLPLLHSPGIEYLVAVGILRLDEDGNGTGELMPAIELKMEDGRIEVVASAADPLKLTKVTRQ